MGSATVLDTGPHWNKEDHVGQARMRHIWLAYKKEWESVWWAGKLWEGPRNSTGYFSASEGWASSPDRNKIKAWREISLEKAIHFKAWNCEGEPATAHQVLQTWTHSAQDSLQHPNFLVPKPNDGKYWFVQDCDDWLWSIHPHSSTGAKPIHPPHLVPGNAQCFSVLTLKDALLCIPLHLDLHSFLAFEWKDPNILKATQCTWTVLLQSFMSPHLFGNMLARTEPEKWGSLRKCWWPTDK